jgi:enediyne biosynthesis protein E5
MARQKKDVRLVALRRFAISITVLNVLGHAFFGFEQSFAQPLVAVATAYTMEILLELVDARASGRPPRFAGGLGTLVNFLLSAHITGLAVAMLLYANDRLMPVVFATAVAMGSKAIFRAPIGNGTRHFLNPSNFGITVTLLLFPWVGIAPPYHFTENLSGAADWIVPAVLVASGALLNFRLTRKGPLILGWLGGFAGQAVLRNLLFGTPLVAALLPVTGVAFLLFTFYMVTDPGTTPFKPRNQVVFGAAVAAVYGLLVATHVVFGLFFALTIVSTARGLCLYAHAFAERGARTASEPQVPALMRRAQS